MSNLRVSLKRRALLSCIVLVSVIVACFASYQLFGHSALAAYRPVVTSYSPDGTAVTISICFHRHMAGGKFYVLNRTRQTITVNKNGTYYFKVAPNSNSYAYTWTPNQSYQAVGYGVSAWFSTSNMAGSVWDC